MSVTRGARLVIPKTLFFLIRSLRADRAGSIGVMSALFVTSFVGMGALAIEAAELYLARVENQRTSDIVAQGTALVAATGDSAATITAIGGNLASLNELGATANVSQTGQTIVATVSTTTPIHLARLWGNGNIPVTASSTVTWTPPVSNDCAFATAADLTITGGTHFDAPGCVVGANGAVSVTGGSNLTAQTVTAGSTISDSGGSSITATNQYQNQPIQNDPAASNTSVSSELTNLASVGATSVATATIPAQPSCGTRVNYTVTSSATAPPANACIGTLTLNWTGTTTLSGANISGPIKFNTYGAGLQLADGTYYLPAITIPWGSSVSMGAGTYYFYGALTDNNGASTLNLFPADGTLGNYYFSQGISIGGGFTANFGPGNYTIAGGILDGGYLHLGDSGAGTYTILINGGITVEGSWTFSLGASNTGNYTVLVSGGINTGGSSNATFGPGNYTVVGPVSLSGSVTTGDGNWTVTDTTDTYAFQSTGGGTKTFGNGTYTIDGNVDFGNGTTDIFNNEDWLINGTLNFDGGNTSYSNTGTAVSFFTTGAITLSGGSNVSLNALSGAVLATTASGSQAIQISGGNSNALDGVVYAKNGTLAISGGASTTTQSGACLELIASSISLSGGTTTSVSCPGFTGASSGDNTVALTQ